MSTITVSERAPVDREHAFFLLREMLRIRRFEEKAAEMYSLQKIHGFLHLYIGEEATGVGAMQAFTPDDAIVATYREHGQALARGIPSTVLMAEMFGKATGCSHGHGGSMHFFDASRRFYGGYAIGGGRQMEAQHSHSLEGWYAHIPGIKVLTPASVADAYGMLLAALQEPDPVFLFEHATLYPLEGEVDEAAGQADINRAAVRRAGQDITLITYGGTLGKTMQAANLLARNGVEAEVIDLRLLRPLDIATIVNSVTKTHRAVIVDEAWRTGSFAAEISAQIMENSFDELDAPVQRVCSAEVPMPYAKHLETAALPKVEEIVSAAQGMISHHG